MGIGGNHERAHGSIRFSLSRFNTTEDVDAVVESISAIVANLRRISPLKK
jgi:cysteine desulfurase